MNVLVLRENLNRFAPPPFLQRREEVEKPLVLVVENHDDTRFMLRYALETWGYRVIEAAEGETAISLTEKNRPNLVLMDMKLTALDGVAATRRIRENPRQQHLPIVFFTAMADPASRAAAYAAGANDFITKPFELDCLRTTVGTLINNDMRSKRLDKRFER